jgi:hypothetical protein
MTKTFTIRTDQNGAYHRTDTFAPPAPFGFHVELFATFTAPPALQFDVNVDLSSNGSHQTKTLKTATGSRVSLGSWFISSGQNLLVISGQTVPIAVDVDITVQIEADLTF